MARQSLRFLPVGMYGMVMGLVGLGLAWRTAGVSPWISEAFIALGAAAFGVLFPSYLAKLFRYPEAVKAEFASPAQLGFCGTLPVGMTLVAAGLVPHAPAVAAVLWWTAYALQLAFMVGAVARWLAGGIALAEVNAGWVIVVVGGIVVPLAGLPLGYLEASRFMFGACVALAPFVVALVLLRAVTAPPLPAPLRPTWFILLAPPMLLYINGPGLWGPAPWIDAAFHAGLILAAALLAGAWGFWRWPFAPTWWAFTFPLDAVASAAMRYALAHPTPLWLSIAGLALFAATAFVLLVGARTISALRAGTLLAPPAPAATPRSAASPAA